MSEAFARITGSIHGIKSGADFDPLFRNAHLQTVVAHLWPRRLDTARFPVERRLIPTEPGVQVLVETQRPSGRALAEVVLVHGLESSGASGYMRGMSQAALDAGMAVHRFHMRTCGGTEQYANTLYHSGLTCDLLAFLRQLGTPVHLLGFSLGGNVVLKLAGELGEAAPPLIAGVCAISAPIDLAASSRRLADAGNRLYERRFVRRMRRRLLATGRYARADFAGLRSIFDIDERFTGPSFGFHGAAHYYATQSANQFLADIRVPALLIQAKDDTFIPFSSFDHPAVRENPYIELLATEHGGHLGFLSRGRPRFWLEPAVIGWILGNRGTTGPRNSSGE